MARVIAVSPNKKMGAKLIYKVAKQGTSFHYYIANQRSNLVTRE